MAFVQIRDNARVNQFERLKKRSDFLTAASGRRFHTERMTVQGLRRDDSDGLRIGLRIGLTVTKRVGHATERNRIKRRLREATRLAVAKFATEGEQRAMPREATCDIAAGQIAADIVVIARRPVLSADFDVLIEDFVRALHNVTKPGQPKARPGQRSKQAGASHPRRGRGTQPSHSS